MLILILIAITISGAATKQDINDISYAVAIGIDVRTRWNFKA